MSNRKTQGKSRNQSKSQSQQQQQQYQTQGTGNHNHQQPSPYNQSFNPAYAAEPGYSVRPSLMYTQYPSTLPGQFLTGPGAYMSPHLQFPRPPTGANGSPTSTPANYFQSPAHMQHMVPRSLQQQYVQSSMQQRNAPGNPPMSLQSAYLSGATGPAVSGLPGYPADAMSYARGMLGGIADPHLVSKQPWGMNSLNPAHVSMMQSMAQQNVGQTGSIEENVEKQIDKLSSRRPKRARRANYNLKPAVPGLDKNVGAAFHHHSNPIKSASHKPTSPRKSESSVPAKAEKSDSQSASSKSASNRSTFASRKPSRSATDGNGNSSANETKPKKKRKRNPETTSHYRGVSWNKANKSWKACIKVKGKNIHIGYFGDDVDAAKAYDMIAQQYRGSSAKVNFPESRVEFSRAVSANVE